MPAATMWSAPSSGRRLLCSERIAASSAAIFRSKNCGRTTPRSTGLFEMPSRISAKPSGLRSCTTPRRGFIGSSFASSEPDDHFAERRSRLHGLESFAKIFERHDLADDRGQLARSEPAEQLGDQARVNF